MIDLPEPLLTTRIKASLKRGSVLRTPIKLKGNTHIKRLFILNRDLTDGMAYFVLSTSRVDWYRKHSMDPNVQGNFRYYECGATACNQTDDMVVDLREVYSLPISQLVKNLKMKKLDFLPSMPEQEMGEIINILSGSKLIPDYIKSRII